MNHRGGTSAPDAGEGKGPQRVAARLIALIGFMAAGKSTVGARLAELLGWTFVDVDHAIEAHTGRTIADLFRDDGEPSFRVVEADLTRELLARNHAVLALGGGWAVQPGAFDAVPPGARTVWLRVSVSEALRRAAADPTLRPLLGEKPDPEAAERLLEGRKSAYARADHTVDVDGRTPDEVVAEILRILESD